MPIRKKQNGDKVDDIEIVKRWIEIPVKPTNTSIDTETYLVSVRVADYIELLESLILDLPKLPKIIEQQNGI